MSLSANKTDLQITIKLKMNEDVLHVKCNERMCVCVC